MKFEILRDLLLKPLQQIAGVVERKQTMPVLSNVLVKVENNELTLTGSDLEIEIITKLKIEDKFDSGEVTIPARKLLDICKSLPSDSSVHVSQKENKAILSSGPSNRFSLSTLPANEFPEIEKGQALFDITLPQNILKKLIDKTLFCVAQQDVRFYLNGLMLEITPDLVRTVASDGHRLATCYYHCVTTDKIKNSHQVILPRKGVQELYKTLQDSEDPITVVVGSNFVSAKQTNYRFTCKLIDAKFPDYNRVIPKSCDLNVVADRQLLRQALSRVAILANEKYKGIWFELVSNNLQIRANNPENEEAEEQIEVEFEGDKQEVGFNVAYLLEVLSALEEDLIKIQLSSKGGSSIIQGKDQTDTLYVVMPMKI